MVRKDKWLNDRKGVNMNKVQQIISVIVLAVGIALPVKAQMFDQTATPVTAFRSTSTMVGSGSTYSSTPKLSENGTATYSGESSSNQQPSGPRKIITPPNSGTQQPIGDAVIPLLTMLAVYCATRGYRRRRV